jgi:hypothetical protein
MLYFCNNARFFAWLCNFLLGGVLGRRYSPLRLDSRVARFSVSRFPHGGTEPYSGTRFF